MVIVEKLLDVDLPLDLAFRRWANLDIGERIGGKLERVVTFKRLSGNRTRVQVQLCGEPDALLYLATDFHWLEEQLDEAMRDVVRRVLPVNT